MIARPPPALLLLLALTPLLLATAPLGAGGETRDASVAVWQPSSQACVAAPLGADDPELEALLREVLGERVDRYGVVVHHLERGSGAAVNPDKVFSTASLFKLPVMYEVFRQSQEGRLSLAEAMTITEGAASWDLGTLGAWASVGDRVSIERLLEMMIRVSDNASAVMLANRVGWSQVDQSMRELGLCDTRVATADPVTSAADTAALLLSIVQEAVPSPESAEQMEQMLLSQGIRDRIPAGVPEQVEVGNKTANLPNATHDVGVVYAPGGTYVLAVLSDLSWQNAPIVELSSAVYEYYNDGLEVVDDLLSATALSFGRFLAY